eukprot:gene9749-34074_t
MTGVALTCDRNDRIYSADSTEKSCLAAAILPLTTDTFKSEEPKQRVARFFHLAQNDGGFDEFKDAQENSGTLGGGGACNGVPDPADCEAKKPFCVSTESIQKQCPVACDTCNTGVNAPKSNTTAVETVVAATPGVGSGDNTRDEDDSSENDPAESNFLGGVDTDGLLPPTPAPAPAPAPAPPAAALDSSDTNQTAADEGNTTSAGATAGIVITVILLLVGVGFPAKERPRSRAPTHETWPAPAPAAADSTPAVFVNGAFETPPAAAADDASVNVQKYENYFPKVGAEGGAGVAGGGGGGGNSGNGGAHIYENHAPEHSNLSTVDVLLEIPTEYNSDYQIPDALIVEGSESSDYQSLESPEHSNLSTVDVLPEIPTEYNSDYQIPDALIVEGSESSDYQSLESLIVGGFNLDYADLGKNYALYASSA